MPEGIEKIAPIAETKRIVRYGRFLKDFQKEEDINVKGLKGKEFEIFYQEKIEPTLGLLKEEFSPWLDKQKQEFSSYFEDTDWSEVEGAFLRGVKRSFVKQTRLYNKIGAKDDMTKVYSDSQTQRDTALAFAFDFTRSIRIARTQGVEPEMALEIAEHSYDFNPDALIIFSQKFPDLPLYAFTYALTDRPHSPEAFLQKVQEMNTEMKDKFPDLPASIVLHAAIFHPKNPGAVLEQKGAEITSLSEEFPEFKGQVLNIVMNKNPRQILLEATRKLYTMRQEFSDLPKELLTNAVFKLNTREYLLAARIELQKLKKEFSEFSESDITSAYIRRGDKTSVFMDSVKQKTISSKEKYLYMTDAFVRRRLINSGGDTKVLNKIEQEAQELKAKHPDLPITIIYESTQFKDSAQWLDDYRKRYRSSKIAA